MPKWSGIPRPLKVMVVVEVFLVAGWLAVQPSEPVVIVAVDMTTTISTAATPSTGTDPTSPTGTVTTFELITTPPTTVNPVTTVTDPTTTFTAPVIVTVAEQFLTDATNDLRTDLALPSLSVDVTLKAYAWNWAMHMAVTGTVSHSDIESLLDGWTLIGENVVAASDADSAIDALIASPSHYEVIVNPAYTDMGIGVVLDAEGTMWVAQVLAGDIATTTTVTVPEVTLPTLPDVTLPTPP